MPVAQPLQHPHRSLPKRARTFHTTYDALGRRIYREQPNMLPTSFTYDGDDVLLSNMSGSVSSFQNGPGIDNILSSKIAGGSSSSYSHLDHLGTPLASSTAAGVLTGGTTIPDSFGYGVSGFTGREYDSYLDIQYSRARMYDPKLGRFISEDPIGFVGGDINLYGYVKNRPTMLRDPSGKFPIVVVVVAGVLIAGEGALHLYFESRARSINWPGGDHYGRAKHCYVSCMSTRVHLGNPAVVTLGGYAQEAVNTYQGAELAESFGDLQANATGIQNAYFFWRSCEELCRTCQ